MDKLSNAAIKGILANLCCSRCKNEFESESFELLENYSNTMICHLTCKKCGKDFGQIIFNYNKNLAKHSPLEVVNGPKPIDFDDVIDAHNFIKNLK